MKKEVENPEHKFPQANDNFSANHCTKKDLQNSLIDLTNDLLFMHLSEQTETERYKNIFRMVEIVSHSLNALRK